MSVTALDYAGVRERLGMPVTPPPRVRLDLIGREKPKAEPAPEPSPALVEPPAPWFAPFNFYKLAGAEAVIHLVALKHGFKFHDVIGSARNRKVMIAKREAVHLVTTHCRPMSLVQLGRVFHKNHATIINLLGRRKSRRALDA